jgi:hypothetical protein
MTADDCSASIASKAQAVAAGFALGYAAALFIRRY